ncbi:MAG TPA: septal ring lytic transglycosylase RlpA family protein [Nevskia sp.]|nr:septal ring lytic transglycosylase RlpA family protein [Nevskia sp.]
MIGRPAAAMRSLAAIAICCAAALSAGCSDVAVRPAPGGGRVHTSPSASPAPAPSNNPNQDGPPAAEEVPANVAQIPDAVPVPEPKSNSGNPDSYEVYGDHYVILKDARGYRERGYASWYGKKFQGKRTSSGEPYDMFKMTAAHKTLPIPCYAKVTSIENGRSVIVRINDRGPFHEGRIIDLSYTAAVKLGSLGKGSIAVEVEAIDPSMPQPATMVARAPPQAAKPAPVAPAPPPAPAPATVAMAAPVRPAVPVVTLAPGQRLTLDPTLSPPGAAPALSVSPPAAAAIPAPPTQVAAVASGTASSALRYLQAGLFYDPINAISLREQLNGLGFSNVQLKNDVRNGANVSRVLLGPFSDEDALALVRKRLGDMQMNAVPVVE